MEPLNADTNASREPSGLNAIDVGAAETARPARKLESALEVEDDNRAVGPAKCEPPAIGVERPGRNLGS